MNRGTTLLESLNSSGCWNFSFVGVLEVCVSGANPEEAAEWPHPQNEEEVCLQLFELFHNVYLPLIDHCQHFTPSITLIPSPSFHLAPFITLIPSHSFHHVHSISLLSSCSFHLPPSIPLIPSPSMLNVCSGGVSLCSVTCGERATTSPLESSLGDTSWPTPVGVQCGGKAITAVCCVYCTYY